MRKPSLLFLGFCAVFAALSPTSTHAQDPYGYANQSYYPTQGTGGYGQGSYAQPSAFDGISYDLLDLSYRYMVFDGEKSFLDDGHAIELDLSIDLLSVFFVEADLLYGSTKADVEADEFFDLEEEGNYTQLELGLGVHFPISTRLHLVASGGFFYENQDLSDDVFDNLEDFVDGGGFYFRPGVRVMLTDRLEAGAFLEYKKLSDAEEGDWGASGNLIYHITDGLGISGHVGISEDVNTYGIGLRLSW